MGMEEGHGGGSGVQGDEGGRQGAGQAPGKEALPRDHLENIRNNFGTYLVVSCWDFETQ